MLIVISPLAWPVKTLPPSLKTVSLSARKSYEQGSEREPTCASLRACQ